MDAESSTAAERRAMDASNGEEGVKGPNKVSCLACRAAKRKCQSPNAETTCRRCSIHKIPCEYRKHRRGRTKKGSTAPSGSRDTLEGPPGNRRIAALPRSSFISTAADDVESMSDDDNQAEEHLSFRETTTIIDENNPATSSRSRLDIQFSRVVPEEKDSSPYVPATNPFSHNASSGSLERILRMDCPDPVTTGLVSESDAFELFEFYFRHLNVTLAILDPILHTPSYCRDRSTLLFTAVLTVTAKIIRPKAYSHCLLLSNKLLGQAFEHGLCSVEIVQAINLLTQWKKADDATSWRRVGYAIRMAQELKLNVRGKRPLPKHERQAREILNRERAWLNLLIADYHLAIHHTLPKMISDDTMDPVEWVKEHPHAVCPGEALLAPLIEFSRMCRLYADMLEGMNGDASSLRKLEWIEMAWKRWRETWIKDNHEFDFPLQHQSTIKMDDALFRFHIAEFRLLYTARYRSEGQVLDANTPTTLSFTFYECVDAALGIATCFQVDFVRHRFLPYAFNRVWVALAVTSVWLIKTDRARVIHTLTDVRFSTEEASCSADDMSAYTHRLLKHLLGGISGSQYSTAAQVAERAPIAYSAVNSNSRSTANGANRQAPTQSNAPAVVEPPWALSSASEIIQDQLWNPNHPPSRGDTGMVNLLGISYSNDGSFLNPANQSSQPGMSHFDELFPPADDEFWRILFPVSDNAMM